MKESTKLLLKIFRKQRKNLASCGTSRQREAAIKRRTRSPEYIADIADMTDVENGPSPDDVL